ncbi:MAG: hypothetical protein Q8P20_06305 [bacterium]|nr:hypothetical protein [bacterium]
MDNTYTPRIKAATAKNLAKSILSDKSGKKISDTKFKEMMKKDKDLKQFAYTGKNSTLDKFKAKKFFNKVISSASSHEKFKVNKIAAKKLGLNINKKGEASQIGLNKIYQHAAKEEIAAADTGPSQQELRREAKREKAIQKMRTQDRASDRRNEYDKEAKDQNGDDNKSSSSNRAAPSRQAGTGSMATSQTGTNQNNYQIADNTSNPSGTGPPEMPDLFLPPLNNLSTTQPNVDVITKKLEIAIKQKIYNLRIFKVIGPEVLNKSLMNLGMDKIPTPANQDILKKISLECGAQLYIYGTVEKKANILLINLEVINSETDRKITLVNIEQSSLDLFDLENKISWQIDNAFKTDNSDFNNNIPSENKAIDLPI